MLRRSFVTVWEGGGRQGWCSFVEQQSTLIVEQVSLKTGQLVHARRSILIRKLSAKELRELKRDRRNWEVRSAKETSDHCCNWEVKCDKWSSDQVVYCCRSWSSCLAGRCLTHCCWSLSIFNCFGCASPSTASRCDLSSLSPPSISLAPSVHLSVRSHNFQCQCFLISWHK